ncbi:SRPBCC domain-containing protein [Taibaiella soli]|uniref:SRPBCC domain-containing protein n=1 Tax=Taibaiella soli TaxID=1649169 RepID=A0A2W2BBF7_9BACT|nr:SRPBCC domain-containing protein [Taibaiella soli]PZF73529.1 SRPBCC domain-containing protein [Taibaiella soli]
MKSEFAAQVTIHIDANPEAVWDALVNPAMIKQYFFGTDAISDWREGSTLQFKGEYEGKEYLDKGVIIKYDKPKILQYTYLSSMSGKEDKPENYALITYALTPDGNNTKLDITQDNIPTATEQEHSLKNWSDVSKHIKQLVENTPAA